MGPFEKSQRANIGLVLATPAIGRQTQGQTKVFAQQTLWIDSNIVFHVQSNLCTTATLETLKLMPLLTGGRLFRGSLYYKN
jgi:hypothetical protein